MQTFSYQLNTSGKKACRIDIPSRLLTIHSAYNEIANQLISKPATTPLTAKEVTLLQNSLYIDFSNDATTKEIETILDTLLPTAAGMELQKELASGQNVSHKSLWWHNRPLNEITPVQPEQLYDINYSLPVQVCGRLEYLIFQKMHMKDTVNQLRCCSVSYPKFRFFKLGEFYPVPQFLSLSTYLPSM